MDWEKLPVKQILLEISNQPDATEAVRNIIELRRESLPSSIWNSFGSMDLQDDIRKTTIWLQDTINKFPITKGIYLGLDTLNMNEGDGSNVEIGLNSDCDPTIFSDEWTYNCDSYGKGHLIEGLFLASKNFDDDKRWPGDERSFAEYVIFLGYSGIVLREALLNLKINNDFISIWGFHDGDMFFLVNKIDAKITVISNVNM